MKRWKAEAMQLRIGKGQVDKLLGEVLWREQNTGKELGMLCGQGSQFPEVQIRLAEAEAEVSRLKAQEGELERVKKQLA